MPDDPPIKALNEYVREYRRQLKSGHLREAYRGVMEYMSSLGSRMRDQHPDWAVGNIYPGYLDMTYFPVATQALGGRGLKIAIVFIHETGRFEAWLAGRNKDVQKRYWDLFRRGKWERYRVPPSTAGTDSILEHTIADEPDFDHPDVLTRQLEAGVLRFIGDIEGFLSKH